MVVMAFENLQSDRGCQLHIPPIMNNPVLGQVCLNKVKAKHECKITLSRGVGVTYRFPRITDNCSRWSSSSNWFKVSFIDATFFTFLFPQSTEIHSDKTVRTLVHIISLVCQHIIMHTCSCMYSLLCWTQLQSRRKSTLQKSFLDCHHYDVHWSDTCKCIICDIPIHWAFKILVATGILVWL